LIATGYSGFVTSAERIPWAGYGAVIAYSSGFILPLIVEHWRLGNRFNEIETTFLTNRRRDIDPPRQEILPPSPQRPLPHRQKSLAPAIMACTLIATGLISLDIIELIINMPTAAPLDGTISNF